LKLSASLVFCLLAVGLAAEEGWLAKEINLPARGSTQWTLILATGGFGSDPVLAAGMRKKAVELLETVGASGDKVQVVYAEMKPWGSSSIIPIEGTSQALPLAPMPESRGGHDIERVLAEVAPSAKGPILFFSSGPSQLPKDGVGQLMGGTGEVSGFGKPIHRTVTISTDKGNREIQISVLTRPGLFTGTDARVLLRPATNAKSLDPIQSSSSASSKVSGSNPLWYGASAVIGVLIGLSLRRSGKKEPDSEIDVGLRDLEAWKQEAKALQRRLDLIAQEMTESVSTLSERSSVEHIELREELLREGTALKIWDQTAMDFLDGIDRTLENANLGEEGRKTLERITKQFIALTQRTGIDVISPEIGSPVLDGHHSIEVVKPAPEGKLRNTVARVLQPGFRRGSNVIRTAKIEMFGEDK
jgi:molecular chaperone GrpE (heat shock protein)